MTYAKNTKVSVARSEVELKELLRKHGATSMMTGESAADGRAFVAFEIHGHRVRLEISLPPPSDFARTETGRARTPIARTKAWEQACRERWRTVVLLTKAKLEAVRIGQSTMVREFLADTMLPDGSTLHEKMQSDERWRRSIASGDGPPLLFLGEPA